MPRTDDFARLLRERDFRWLWLSQSTSLLGDAIVTVALALFVIDRTGSASDLGFVLAAGSLPLIALILLGGVWADRLPRHRVMIVTDLVRCALHALLAALIFSGEIRIWQIVVIEALFGAAEAFFLPAATGLVPQTVAEQDIQHANALIAIARNVATVIGPSIATALVLTAGAGWAFAIDAATFIVSAGCLLQVRPRRRELADDGDPERPSAVAVASMWREIRDGYREVRERAWVWATLIAFSLAQLTCLAPLLVLGPLVARAQYGRTGVYGAIIAVFGVGTVVGSLAGIRYRPKHPLRTGLLVVLCWPAATVLYALGVTLFAVVPAMALAGVGVALFDVCWATALAERIPPDKLSRVSAYDWLVSAGLVPVGFVLAGPAVDAFGAAGVLSVGSVLAAVAIAAALAPAQTRRLQRLEAA